MIHNLSERDRVKMRVLVLVLCLSCCVPMLGRKMKKNQIERTEEKDSAEQKKDSSEQKKDSSEQKKDSSEQKKDSSEQKKDYSEQKKDYSEIRYDPVWSYDNENNWPGYRCKNGGRRQSPIDIKTEDVIKDYGRQFIKFGPLKFTGYKEVLVSGINNGHTVQFSSEGEEAIHPIVTGGPLRHMYRLEQIHFHWLSEHSINGVKYPMEIHFVHVRSDLTVFEALTKRDGLAILAVFVNVQAELEDYQQDANEVMQHIPRLMNTGDRISGVLLDMTNLLSPNKDSYYSYAGSLTSPECNEVVTWIIFEIPIYLTDAQYRLFGKVGVGRHNFRSLQKLNHHVVFTPVANKLHVPQIVVFFQDMYSIVTGFFKNVTSFVAGMKNL